MTRLLDYLPRGDMVDDASWQRRHRFLLWVLVLQAPALAIFGLALGNPLLLTGVIALVPLVTALGGMLVPGRLGSSLFVTGGLTACCAGLVILSGGSIEAHFSFFVVIAFLTLYQNWVPFVWAIVFTVFSHALGSLLVPTLMFNHHMGQHDPWLWSLIHGFAVLLASIGVMIFCRITEDEQRRRAALGRELADAQVRQQEFTSELLLNLARRNQSMFHRQLDIINDLEERERDPDALADLFRLDHLATRVRRNAESLLVLSGEQPARVWSAPVPLRDVVRAGIAETEDLERVRVSVEEAPRVAGSVVADLTHMVAELVENAARYSPPATPVVLHSRTYHRAPGAHLLIVEDTGIGMPADQLAAANELLADPQEVDVSAAARQLGFHVVARLAERHGIEVSLTPTPGCGVTAVLVLPAALFAEPAGDAAFDTPADGLPARVPAGAVPAPRTGGATDAGEAPVSGPPVLDGRHSWPGADLPPSDDRAEGDGVAADGPMADGDSEPDGSGARRRSAHAVDGVTPARPETVAGAAPRRELIHPIVVPPPAPLPEDGAAVPAPGAPAPRRSGEEDAPVAAGPNGLVLSRRVPQTHLAPELIRRQPGTSAPVGTPAPAERSAAPGAPMPAPAAAAPAPAGPMQALSAYQASREAARSAIHGDGDGAPDHQPPHGGTTRGRTS